MFIFERPVAADIVSAWLPILYAGIFSTGIAYTLQIVGQKYTEATVASLMMCTESVFAVITAAIILGQVPSVREGIGCAVMFSAIIISQAGPFLKERFSKNDNML